MFAAISLTALALVQPHLQGSQVSARRGFVAQTAGAIAATAFVGVAPSQAGYLSNLGFGDAAPAAGDVDKEILGSKDVQRDLAILVKYSKVAKDLAAQFEAEPQSDIKPIVASFNRAEIRTAMNSVGTVFSEDFQKQSDRLVRNVIQDLSELDSLDAIKEGATRSPKKIKSVARFTVKLDKDLAEFLSFVK